MLCGLIGGGVLPAAAFQPPDEIPAEVRSGLQHLIQISSNSGEDRELRVEQIAALLDMVTAGDDLPLGSEGVGEAACAYGHFDVHCLFKDILRIGFSPDIPSHVLMPSSVRFARWCEIEGQPGRTLPALCPLIEGLDAPVVLRGVEYVENTPDLNSGAYYGYPLDRTLILLRHEGRLFLISISIQKTVSDVGRKGAVVGADSDWNYLYSEEAGLGKPGLGWVQSHMYAGGSVTVYADLGQDRPMVRCGIFRWLRAGWASINVVRRSHIEEGLKRYTETMRQILENPNLPDGDSLAAGFARIDGLSDAVLLERTRSYFETLAETSGAQLSSAAREWLNRLIAEGAALHLDRDRMEALLAVQYLKAILGKPTGPEVSGLATGRSRGRCG